MQAHDCDSVTIVFEGILYFMMKEESINWKTEKCEPKEMLFPLLKQLLKQLKAGVTLHSGNW